MSLPGTRPQLAGGANMISLSQAAIAWHAGRAMTDLRLEALHGRPAPKAWLDLVPPFPLPVHPLVPVPLGDPGGFGTSRALEDR